MYGIFQTRKSYCNLRSQTDCASNCVNNDKFGLNLFRYCTSKVSNMVPLEIKNSENFEIFKTKFEIRSLKIVIVTCRRPI